MLLSIKNYDELIELVVETENNNEKDLLVLFEKLKIDKKLLEDLHYCDNPFINRNWEFLNIGGPNISKVSLIHMLQLKVKIYELFVNNKPLNSEYTYQLSKARKELEEYHKGLCSHD